MVSKQTKGFTLIEIIITTALIAILTVVPVLSYNAIQKNARDTRRKQDLDRINTALTEYRNQEGEYPPDSDLQPLLDGGYMQVVPTDPLDKDNTDPLYGYVYESDSTGTTFLLYGLLEETEGGQARYYFSNQQGGSVLPGTPTLGPATNTPPPAPFLTATPTP